MIKNKVKKAKKILLINLLCILAIMFFTFYFSNDFYAQSADILFPINEDFYFDIPNVREFALANTNNSQDRSKQVMVYLDKISMTDNAGLLKAKYENITITLSSERFKKLDLDAVPFEVDDNITVVKYKNDLYVFECPTADEFMGFENLSTPSNIAKYFYKITPTNPPSEYAVEDIKQVSVVKLSNNDYMILTVDGNGKIYKLVKSEGTLNPSTNELETAASYITKITGLTKFAANSKQIFATTSTSLITLKIEDPATHDQYDFAASESIYDFKTNKDMFAFITGNKLKVLTLSNYLVANNIMSNTSAIQYEVSPSLFEATTNVTIKIINNDLTLTCFSPSCEKVFKFNCNLVDKSLMYSDYFSTKALSDKETTKLDKPLSVSSMTNGSNIEVVVVDSLKRVIHYKLNSNNKIVESEIIYKNSTKAPSMVQLFEIEGDIFTFIVLENKQEIMYSKNFTAAKELTSFTSEILNISVSNFIIPDSNNTDTKCYTLFVLLKNGNIFSSIKNLNESLNDFNEKMLVTGTNEENFSSKGIIKVINGGSLYVLNPNRSILTSYKLAIEKEDANYKFKAYNKLIFNDSFLSNINDLHVTLTGNLYTIKDTELSFIKRTDVDSYDFGNINHFTPDASNPVFSYDSLKDMSVDEKGNIIIINQNKNIFFRSFKQLDISDTQINTSYLSNLNPSNSYNLRKIKANATLLKNINDFDSAIKLNIDEDIFLLEISESGEYIFGITSSLKFGFINKSYLEDSLLKANQVATSPLFPGKLASPTHPSGVVLYEKPFFPEFNEKYLYSFQSINPHYNALYNKVKSNLLKNDYETRSSSEKYTVTSLGLVEDGSITSYDAWQGKDVIWVKVSILTNDKNLIVKYALASDLSPIAENQSTTPVKIKVSSRKLTGKISVYKNADINSEVLYLLKDNSQVFTVDNKKLDKNKPFTQVYFLTKDADGNDVKIVGYILTDFLTSDHLTRLQKSAIIIIIVCISITVLVVALSKFKFKRFESDDE